MRVTVNGRTYEVERRPDAVVVEGEVIPVSVSAEGDARTVTINDFSYRVELPPRTDAAELVVRVDGRSFTVRTEGRLRAPVSAPKAAPARRRADAPPGAIVAAMSGRIVSIRVEVGQEVKAGQPLLVLEAMKMENEITAPKDGVVKEVPVAAGARVNEGDVLVVLG
ncbi:MAG TPA: biotin/lipoyl-containing protein [Dehalococcoidia bacterium]|nr:biotin/lipoyl-containing protein [Dehalococcoidia bacterium]